MLSSGTCCHDDPLIRKWGSWPEFVQYAKGVKDDPDALQKGESQNAPNDWNGGHSFDECIQFASTGWKEGRERISRIREQLTHKLNSGAVPFNHFDVTGSCVDVGKYLTGDPECMLQFTEQLDERPDGMFIKLRCNVIAASSVSVESMRLWGAMVSSLADLLETVGFRVRIEAGQCNCGKLHDIVVLKDYAEPLSVDALSFALVHPGVLRRLFFAAMERLPRPYRDKMSVPGGYGRCDNFILDSEEYPIQVPSAQDWHYDKCEGYDENSQLQNAVTWINEVTKPYRKDLEQ